MSPDTLPRWRVMPALAIGTMMVTLDISAVNIALPTLSRTFGLPLVAVEWVVLAYVLTITGLLLSFGRLADRVGRRRVYAAGMAVFTLASGLCAAAPSAALLVLARVVQGLGAAMMTANSAPLLISSFSPGERGRALGVFGAAVGAGLALGPPLGGALVGHLSWRWIFIINIPLGLYAQWRLRSCLPADARSDGGISLGLPAAALWCAALAMLMLGLSLGPVRGWSSPGVWGLFSGAVAILGLFAFVEARSSSPLLPMSMALGPVGSAGFLTLAGQVLSIAVGFHLPLYLEDVLSYAPDRSGRWMAVLPLTALVFAPFSGRWSDRWGSRRIAFLGMTLTSLGFVVLAGLGLEPHPARLTGGMAIIGTGLGLFTVPNTSALLGAAPPDRLGVASGLQATLRNLGITGGAAATAALAASRYAAHGGGSLASGHQEFSRSALALATRDLYLVMAGVAALAAAAILRQAYGAETADAGDSAVS